MIGSSISSKLFILFILVNNSLGTIDNIILIFCKFLSCLYIKGIQTNKKPNTTKIIKIIFIIIIK